MLKSVVLSIVTLTSVSAFASVTNLRIGSGSSNVFGDPVVEVWGAMVGDANNQQQVPYDNCHEGLKPNELCYSPRVNGSHEIVVQFVESETLTQLLAPIGVVKSHPRHGMVNRLVARVDRRQSRVGTNQTGLLRFTWKNICNLLTDVSGSPGVLEVSRGVNRCVDASGNALSGKVAITIGFETSPGSINTSSNTVIDFYLLSN